MMAVLVACCSSFLWCNGLWFGSNPSDKTPAILTEKDSLAVRAILGSPHETDFKAR
jgi:hypothetical protein